MVFEFSIFHPRPVPSEGFRESLRHHDNPVKIIKRYVQTKTDYEG